MPATVGRRLSTLASFYRYCHVEGVLERNPAANVRRPRVDYESRTLGLDRNELGALLVQAGLGSARDLALITLLAMNGLRIAEALGSDIDDLDLDRGHRTLRIVRKGGKHVTIPFGATDRHPAGEQLQTWSPHPEQIQPAESAWVWWRLGGPFFGAGHGLAPAG
jgi:site-specific recombinase XerC